LNRLMRLLTEPATPQFSFLDGPERGTELH